MRRSRWRARCSSEVPEESDDRRSARMLLDWQVESQSSRQLAPLDEREIAWEGEAIVGCRTAGTFPISGRR